MFGNPKVLSDKYPIKSIGEICKHYSGTGFPTIYQGNDSGKYPFYKVGDISFNVQKELSYLKYCDNYVDDNVVSEIKGTIVPEGTLVFAKIGEAIKLNRRAITTSPCLIDNNVMGLKPVKDKVIDRFLLECFRFYDFDEYARTTAVPSIRKSTIEEVCINVPDMSQQIEYCKFVEQVDKSKFIFSSPNHVIISLIFGVFYKLITSIHLQFNVKL